MKANFKIISTILIILLASLLIAIMISYYTEPIEITSETVNEFANTNHEISKVISENVSGENVITDTNVFDKNSGEMFTDQSGEISGEASGELIPEKPKDISKTESLKEISVDKSTTSVIITSEDTMTNKEKREILTELDTTLMDLLDVIDKVQTIDETRLIIDGSGVQE